MVEVILTKVTSKTYKENCYCIRYNIYMNNEKNMINSYFFKFFIRNIKLGLNALSDSTNWLFLHSKQNRTDNSFTEWQNALLLEATCYKVAVFKTQIYFVNRKCPSI